MKKILICSCLFLAGLFCAAGCGSTAAEGESAVLTDTALAGEESTGTETGEEKSMETESEETDSSGSGVEKKSAGDAEGREAGRASAEQGNADVDSDAAKGTEDDAVLEFPGALSVAGARLVDSSGNPVQLRGISTHGLAWYPDYVNEECFRQLKEEWGADIVRLAMYTAESGGYCTDGNREELKTLVKDGVEYATDCGLYVIIDWHILSDGNPNAHLEEAKEFFGEMSEKYAEYDNVFYEICNEPNGGTPWGEVKRYAEEIIPVIRANDGEGIILVGTPNWCQYVDQAAADPITGYDNVMYTLHFYAATHTDSLRAAMGNAVEAGLPVFVSEYGICDASGNGAIDTNQAARWVEAMDEYGISYVAWNLSNKSESSALLKSGCGKISGFGDEDLSDSGLWLRDMLEQAGTAGEAAGIGSAGGGNRAGENRAGAGNSAGENEVGGGNSTGGIGTAGRNGTGGNGAGTGNGAGGNGDGAGTRNGVGGNATEAGTGNSSGDRAEPGNGTSGGSTADGAAGGIEAGGLEVTEKMVNSWGQGSETFFQYELTLSNVTDSSQNGWTVRLTFSSDITLQNGWNGNYEVDGNVLTISSMDYNARIEKGGSVGDVGFIIQTAADCTLGN